MIAVTAYPVGYAIYLSLERYNLELPQNIKFVGLSNYGAVLSSPYWWQALKVTVIITVISVAITLVLGMLLAQVMHPTLFGRGTVRTAALLEDHGAADEARDPGRAAVPDAGLVPDLRQHLHPDRRGQQHRVGLDPRLRQPVQRAEPGDRLGDLDPHLHLRGDHRGRVHHGLPHRGPRHGHREEVTR